VRERLAVAISASALLVALLGTTSLGQAARGVARSGANVAKQATGAHVQKSSARGPRGRRGPRGPRGPRGFLGAPGEKGDKGDKGDSASDGFEARNTTPVVITGTTSDTESVVLAGPTLPAGKYAVTVQVVLEGVGYSAVSCQARGPGPAGARQGLPGILHIGTGADSVRVGTLPLSFGATLATSGTLQVGCWDDNPSGPNPSATATTLVAVTVGNLTQTGS
jgi:hypothetical protein